MIIDILALFIAIASLVFDFKIARNTEKLNRRTIEQEEHEKRLAREQATITAYTTLYSEVLCPFEIKYSGNFRQQIQNEASAMMNADLRYFRSTAQYKEFKHYLGRIELFAACLHKEIYDRDAFKIISHDFSTVAVPRINCVLSAFNIQSGYENTRWLLTQFEEEAEPTE